MSAKTVFISYRRDPAGRGFARSLALALTSKGYDVFLDVDQLGAGEWAKQILTQVPLRSHFILALTPGALERCANDDDWVRREFELALRSGRNIVPVREESVDVTQLQLDCPQAMKALFKFEVATVQHRGFDRDVELLITGFIAPHHAPLESVTAESGADEPKAAAFRADISRIIKYAPAELIGRQDETQLLNDAWDLAIFREPKRPRIFTFVALGGEGKTSLVAKWAADLAYQDWPGCEAVFAWSFYSQGTREQTAVSSDSFLAEALKFFGDEAMANSPQGAFDKGRRLAQLVGERRTLLILDGLEPLQYAPTSPTPGELKDAGMAALLKGLAANNNGLSVVTTRYSIHDLRGYWRTTAPWHQLACLSTAAGVKLLQTIGVKGSLRRVIPSEGGELFNEFEKLVEDVDGHALTLQVIGQFLVRAFHGDIRLRDRIDIQKADSKIQGGHAFRAMETYVKWLEDESEESRRELAVLRLLGLFDRPASRDCIDALRAAPAIPGLTEPLMGLAEDDWEFSLTSLREARLLTVNRDQGSGNLINLDAHPLLREYSAQRVHEQQPEAWRAAHQRIYEHLCATTKEGDQPTLEDLQPLYQAVAHGCLAGLQEEAWNEVYVDRILRRREHYSWRKLGSYGSDLGAAACFYESPWTTVSTSLSGENQAFLLNQTSLYLRAVGRLNEALDLIRAATDWAASKREWQHAAVGASNLSELEVNLGILEKTIFNGVEVAGAVEDGEQSVIYADLGGDKFDSMDNRTVHADALHQMGRRAEADAVFRKAEQMQAERQPVYSLLYSLAGFRYCDLLLAGPERAAWQVMQNSELRIQKSELVQECRAVSQRAAQTLKWTEGQLGLLTIAVDHLTLGRAALYAVILERSAAFTPLQRPNEPGASNDDERRSGLNAALQGSRGDLDAAVTGLRRSGNMDDLPRGLLTRAWLRFLTGERTGPESAQEDLDEAWEIAERGPMRLFMADIHLYRARLFHAVKLYPWATDVDGKTRGPKDDLDAAEILINECGYHRRDEELADAKAAAVNW